MAACLRVAGAPDAIIYYYYLEFGAGKMLAMGGPGAADFLDLEI